MYDAAYLSALSALAGSLVGGLTSGITTWLSLRNQVRAGRLANQLSQRDDLYKDFILSASKAYGDAILTNQPQMQDLVGLYAMVSRMRVSVRVANRQLRSERDGSNGRGLLRTEQDYARAVRANEKRGRDRSVEGLRRGCARRVAGDYLPIGAVRVDTRHSQEDP